MESINIKAVLQYSATAMAVFLIASVIGYTTGLTNQVHAAQTYQKFKATEVNPTANQGPFVRAIVYIMLNAVVGLSIMLTGPILVRFFRIWFGSILILANNGYAIGEMCSAIAKSIGLKVTILSILSHGIFELSAFILCAGVGLFMGYNIMIDQCKESNPQSYNETILVLYNDMKGCIKFYCKVILPLFIIAGIIEIFISPKVISWLIANKGVI